MAYVNEQERGRYQKRDSALNACGIFSHRKHRSR